MSNSKYLFIFLFFLYLIAGLNCRAVQNELTSGYTNTVVDTENIYKLIDNSKLYSDTSFDKALDTALLARELAENSGDKKILLKSLNNLASLCFKQENFDDAMKFYSEALTLANELNNNSELAAINTSLGRIYRRLGNYEKAIENDLKAIEIFENLKDEKNIALLYNNLGIDYYRLSDYTKTMEYYQKSLDKRIKIADSLGIADSYNNIAMVYDEQKQYNKALEYYNKALIIFKKTGNKSGLADTYNNIAGTFYHKEDFEKVLEYALKSLKIRDELGNKWEISFTLINIGILNKTLGNIEEAVDYLKRGIKIAGETNALSLLSLGYNHLAELYFDSGNFKEAYKFRNSYSAVQDSMFKEESAKAIAEMQTKYETEKRQKEIELLNKEKDIQSLKLIRSENFRIFLLVISVLLVLTAILIYSRYRIKIKTNKLLKDKNQQLEIANATKDKFFTIIAHDLKNPLSGIKIISQSLSENIEKINHEELLYYLNELNSSSANLFELLSNLLQWARSQTGKLQFKPGEINLYETFDNNLKLLIPLAEKKKISIINEIPKSTSVYADFNMLNTVIRNLVSNAIKFTGSDGTISIKAVRKNGTVQIIVKDTGIGIDKEDIPKLFRIDVDTSTIGFSEEKGTGLGLILCKELIEKNRGTIWAESESGKGSAFCFTLSAENY